MKPSGPRLFITTLSCLLPLSGTFAAAPHVDRFDPFALKPGTTNRLTIFGKDLDRIDRVWMLHNFDCDLLPADLEEDPARQRRLQIRVPSQTPVGRSAMRLLGANGVSDLHALAIDDLPSMQVSNASHQRDTALSIPTPVVLEGVFQEFQSDYFRFHAGKDQVLSFEVQAASIGSKADPLVRLSHETGDTLVYMDDAPGRGSACVWATCPSWVWSIPPPCPPRTPALSNSWALCVRKPGRFNRHGRRWVWELRDGS